MARVPVQIVADYDAMSAEAARIVADAVHANPALVLALPTGGTPLGMFKALIAMVESGELEFRQNAVLLPGRICRRHPGRSEQSHRLALSLVHGSRTSSPRKYPHGSIKRVRSGRGSSLL